MPILRVTDAKGDRAVPLQGERFRVGRRNTNQLVVDGVDISREHAEILEKNGDFFVRDLGSKYGTWVNGEKIEERRLAHRDRIRLGPSDHVQIVFLLEDTLGDVSPPGTSTMTLTGGDFRAVSVLLRALRGLGSGRVLDEMLRFVLDSCLELSGAERAAILLPGEDDKLEFRLGVGRGGGTFTRDAFQGSSSVPAKAYSSGEFVDAPDLVEGAGAAHDRTLQLGIRSAVAVPLRLSRIDVEADAAMGRPRVIGVVYMDRSGRGAFLRPTAREALEVLAGEAAVAIENARLYRDSVERARLDQELAFAARVQQALLPERTLRYPFAETAGCNVPSRQIGGDFFDCFLLPDGNLAFLLGDVSGKGPSAALLAASSHGMAGIFAELSTSPAEAVTRLNRAFCRRAPTGRFLTLFYGVLRPDGTLTYCNAGHNHPLWLAAGKKPMGLETGGLPIGVLESEAYEEGTIRLGKADSVVVYSDGITDAESEDRELFGDERLLASLQSSGGASAEAILDSVLASVRGFVGLREPSDDVTLLVVRRL